MLCCLCLVSQSYPTLCDSTGCSPPSSSLHGDLQASECWSGLPRFPPGIFPTQESSPGLLHCRWVLYHLSHQGSPRILEWVAYLFYRGSSWPRNQAGVSGIAGGFFTSWATREVRKFPLSSNFHPLVLHPLISKLFHSFYIYSLGLFKEHLFIYSHKNVWILISFNGL